MTSIVTITMADDRITQVVAKADPADIYHDCKILEASGEIKAYSIITLADHVMRLS